MVELVWLWLRYQWGNELARWFVERVGTGRGRVRKVTAVKLTHKLLVALSRNLATGLVPEGAHVKAACGSKFVRRADRRQVGRAGQACDRSSTGFAAVAKDGARRLQPVRLA